MVDAPDYVIKHSRYDYYLYIMSDWIIYSTVKGYKTSKPQDFKHLIVSV